jgi:hypothetical protein
MQRAIRQFPYTVAAGDIIIFLIGTILGFVTHQINLNNFRWLSTFIPLSLSWLIIAPWFGVYRQDVMKRSKYLWQPALAMIVVAPFAAWLRGAFLNAPILPVFVAVLAATNLMGILIWRILVVLYFTIQKESRNG